MIVNEVLQIGSVPVLGVALLGQSHDSLQKLTATHRPRDASLLLVSGGSHEDQFAAGSIHRRVLLLFLFLFVDAV